jgi:hypothetical protein
LPKFRYACVGVGVPVPAPEDLAYEPAANL